jgi:hypothetical protein
VLGFTDNLPMCIYHKYLSTYELKSFAGSILFACSILVMSSASQAQSVPQTFTYQGMLTESNGSPVTSNIDFKLQIYDPTATCLLYEELQTNVVLTSGLFNIQVGSNIAESKRGSADPGLSMQAIFSNSAGSIRSSGANCISGYTPSADDKRRLKVTVTNLNTNVVTVMSPLQEISMTPYSLVAGDTSKFSGKGAAEFIQVEGSSVTQSKVKSLTENVTSILNLISGNVIVSDTPAGATSAVNKTYVDTKVSSVTPNSSCVSGSFNRWNGTSWVCEPDQNSGGGPAVSDATTTSKGIVQIGAGLAVSSGVVSASIDDAQVTGTVSLSKISGRGSAASYNAPVTGNAGSSELVKGDDSRLIDARVPIDNSVGTAKIVDSAITTNKLSDLSVSDSKISAVSASKLIGSVTSSQISTSNGANEVLKLDGTGKLPAIDGSQLTNLPNSGSASGLQLTALSAEPYTCDGSKSGSLQLTSHFLTCVCRPGAGWVFTKDGVSNCFWTGDPNFGSVVSLLHFEGTHNSTPVTDVVSGNSWTNSGAARISTVDKKFGTSSMYFDGTNSTAISAADSENWNFGAGDFTIEMWIKWSGELPGAYGVTSLFGQNPGASSNVRFQITNTTGRVAITAVNDSAVSSADNALPINQWAHVAVERFGNSLKVYINGVSVISTTLSGSLPNMAYPWEIGNEEGVGVGYKGYLDEYRVTKGLARYQGNFTPPVANFPDQ